MSVTTQSKLEVVPMTRHIGAEVRGLDLERPLAEADRRAINQAWLDHIVLVFPGQDPLGGSRQGDRLFRRDRRIAPAAEIFPGRLFEILPNIMLISNIRENASRSALCPTAR